MAQVGQSSSESFGTGQSSGTSSGTSSSGPNAHLTALYESEYANALSRNDSNYQNLLGGYQNTVKNAGQQFAGIANGYGALQKQVLGGIKNIGASQSQAIRDQYQMALGQQGQQMVNAGLGNTTVTGAMQRGLTLDSQKAQIALSNQIAQLTAGYQSQLGSAGLQARAQGAATQAGLGGQYMGALASYRTPYPSWAPNQSQSSQHSTQQSTNVQHGSSTGSNVGGLTSGGSSGAGHGGLWAGGQPGSGLYPGSGGTINPGLGAYQVGQTPPTQDQIDAIYGQGGGAISGSVGGADEGPGGSNAPTTGLEEGGSQLASYGNLGGGIYA